MDDSLTGPSLNMFVKNNSRFLDSASLEMMSALGYARNDVTSSEAERYRISQEKQFRLDSPGFPSCHSFEEYKIAVKWKTDPIKTQTCQIAW